MVRFHKKIPCDYVQRVLCNDTRTRPMTRSGNNQGLLYLNSSFVVLQLHPMIHVQIESLRGRKGQLYKFSRY